MKANWVWVLGLAMLVIVVASILGGVGYLYTETAAFEESRSSKINAAKLNQVGFYVLSILSQDAETGATSDANGNGSKMPWQAAVLNCFERGEYFQTPSPFYDETSRTKYIENFHGSYPVGVSGYQVEFRAFGGKDAVLGIGKRPAPWEIADGAKDTIIMVEAIVEEDKSIHLEAITPDEVHAQFGKFEEVGLAIHGPLVLFADGIVCRVTAPISREELTSLGTWNGGEQISRDALIATGKLEVVINRPFRYLRSASATP